MAWVVDTCLLIDVAEADSMFGVASAEPAPQPATGSASLDSAYPDA